VKYGAKAIVRMRENFRRDVSCISMLVLGFLFIQASREGRSSTVVIKQNA
jgi:hypothetical protein